MRHPDAALDTGGWPSPRAGLVARGFDSIRARSEEQALAARCRSAWPWRGAAGCGGLVGGAEGLMTVGRAGVGLVIRRSSGLTLAAMAAKVQNPRSFFPVNPMARVYLSLGSNVQPRRHLLAAIDALRQAFGHLIVSPAYRSAAVGFDGADFVNLAVGLDTELSPQDLNDWLHALEDRHGRRRDVPRFSDRTLDIDIVFYGDQVLNGPGHLQIPRKELRHAFVLRPMADIAPDLRHPIDGDRMDQRWAAFPAASEPLYPLSLAAPD